MRPFICAIFRINLYVNFCQWAIDRPFRELKANESSTLLVKV